MRATLIHWLTVPADPVLAWSLRQDRAGQVAELRRLWNMR